MGKSVSTDSLKMLNDNSGANDIVLSSAYLAPVSYYVLLNQHHCLLEKHEHYEKQSYRNRCRIANAAGILDLTIPVEKYKAGDSIRDVKISDHSDWQTQHWRSIEASYNSSPFFEYYSDDLRPYFERKWVFLWDFNYELQQEVCRLLDLDVNINFTGQYKQHYAYNVIDLRSKIHPKQEPLLRIPEYYQVFEQKHGFIPDLTIIDLLFNMGNESQLILNKPIEWMKESLV